MKVVVCLKPIKSEEMFPNELRTEDFIINPYDLYALQQFIELKKSIDCTIICLCMGPSSTKGLLQKAIALGADQAILLNDDLFNGSDTVATSYILVQAIKKIEHVDFVACGRRSSDGEIGQAVYGIGERLNYYCLTDIAEILGNEGSAIQLKQVKDAETIIGRLKPPAVISFYDYVVTQPLINLLALKKARKKEILVLNATDLDVDVDKCGFDSVKVKECHVQKEAKKKKLYMEETAKEKADLIYNLITDKAHNSKR